MLKELSAGCVHGGALIASCQQLHLRQSGPAMRSPPCTRLTVSMTSIARAYQHAEQAVRRAPGVGEAIATTPSGPLRFEGRENEERRKSPTPH